LAQLSAMRRGVRSVDDLDAELLPWIPQEAVLPPPADPGGWSPPPPRRPSRWRRARKVILVAVTVLIVLVIGAGVATYLVARHDLNSMRRIPDPFAAIPAAGRPPRPTGPAARDVTFLVGGLDTRPAEEATGPRAASRDQGRTDTLMLVHLIAGDGGGAYVVSIPRDSWVPIPGHGDGKANWAYSFGGPSLAIRTVEQLTKVRINHFAIIDWDGFRAVTNALGGVTLNIPSTSYDPANHITWTAGTHHLDGTQALLYVRDRYGLAGGDFDRERRQQNYLRAMFTQVRHAGLLANPLQAGSVAHALSNAVSVDSTLGNSQMLHLALSLSKLNMSRIVFATAPYSGTGSVDGQSIVRLNQSIGRRFWHAFEHDSLPAFMRAHGLARLGASTP
jgi:LCP family protein required for cell wall assembly